jgi:predicted dehydrogenase
MPIDISRRLFLAGGGTLALPAFAAPPSARTTVGMIGVGARAHQVMESIKKASAAEIVAVCDAYTGRVTRALARTGGRAKAVDDYTEILGDDAVDAVFVMSPDHWHAKHVIESLEAGKHVYCEKPLTYTVDQGLDIAKAVERSGKVLQVGSQGISSPAEKMAAQMIRQGRLGRVTMVRANYNRNSASGAWIYPIPRDASQETVAWKKFLGPAPRRPFDLARFFRWRCYKDYSGGIATDLFVHLCTTIHRLMDADAPQDVTAMGDLYHWGDSRDVPDTLNAILRYREGFTATLSSTFNNGSGGTGFEFLGTEGSLSVGATTLTFTAERKTESTRWVTDSWPEHLQQAYESANAVRRPRVEPEETRLRGGDATDLHVANFFASVRDGAENVEDVWAGHHAAACAHMVNLSAATGRRVSWDFKARRLMKTQQS